LTINIGFSSELPGSQVKKGDSGSLISVTKKTSETEGKTPGNLHCDLPVTLKSGKKEKQDGR
jgi:hypothetical protein